MFTSLGSGPHLIRAASAAVSSCIGCSSSDPHLISVSLNIFIYLFIYIFIRFAHSIGCGWKKTFLHTLSVTDGTKSFFYTRYRLWRSTDPQSPATVPQEIELNIFQLPTAKINFCIRYRLRKENIYFCTRYRLRRSTDPRSPATASPEIEVCIFQLRTEKIYFLHTLPVTEEKNYARIFFKGGSSLSFCVGPPSHQIRPSQTCDRKMEALERDFFQPCWCTLFLLLLLKYVKGVPPYV